jgi:DNA-binding LacI/PurR family transcriptional regulator
MATIQDVARLAGVSTASVSLVLNQPETRRVGADKKRRILQAVRSLAYRPNGMARALITRSTQILGLVVPLRDPIFFNSFIAGVLTGIQGVLIERGYHLMVYSHRASSGRITPQQLVETRFVDGVIFINTRMCTGADMEATIAELRAAAIPFVMINTYYGHEAINYVGIDDRQTGHQAARCLLQKGQ